MELLKIKFRTMVHFSWPLKIKIAIEGKWKEIEHKLSRFLFPISNFQYTRKEKQLWGDGVPDVLNWDEMTQQPFLETHYQIQVSLFLITFLEEI